MLAFSCERGQCDNYLRAINTCCASGEIDRETVSWFSGYERQSAIVRELVESHLPARMSCYDDGRAEFQVRILGRQSKLYLESRNSMNDSKRMIQTILRKRLAQREMREEVWKEPANLQKLQSRKLSKQKKTVIRARQYRIVLRSSTCRNGCHR